MSEKQRRLQESLDRLGKTPGVVGSVLVSRDGICVLNALSRVVSPETFAAMSAALMGAAETAMSELGAPRTLRVVADTPKHRFIAVGATDELLLVAVLEPDVPLDKALSVLGDTAEAVAKTVAG